MSAAIASSWKRLGQRAQALRELGAGRARWRRCGRASGGCRADSPRAPARRARAATSTRARAAAPARLRAAAARLGGAGRAGAGSPLQSQRQRAAQPVQQLLAAHRLEHVVVGADAHVVVEPAIERVGRDDGHRRVAEALGAQAADRLPAVDAGHRQVHQDRVGQRAPGARAGSCQRRLAGRRLLARRSRRAPAAGAAARGRPPRCRRPARAGARRRSRCGAARPAPRPPRRRAARPGTARCESACRRRACCARSSRRPSGR